jgi:hypothetical protein
MSKRIALTVTKDYVPTWGLWEGAREFIQNYHDADIKGMVGRLSYDAETQTLKIRNEGARLSRNVMLLGFSTKREDEDQAGKYGEGLKLGCLALVKNGCSVTIRTGDEQWKPEIGESSQFPGQEVLIFEVKTGLKDLGRTEITIKGIPAERWEEISGLFLFLSEIPEDQIIKCKSGSILLDPKRAGEVYVKGIFVDKVKDMTYGYDVNQKITDRDRGMVDTFNLKWEVGRMWNEALAKGEQFVAKRVFKLLDDGARDAEYIENTADSKLPDAVADIFEEEYGKDTLPVSDLGESREMQFLGQKTAVVDVKLRRIVERKKGSINDRKEVLKNAVSKRYGADELTPEEWAILDKAIGLVRIALPKIELGQVQVVEFGGESLRGRFDNGVALIRRAELKELRTALFVLIHECAHAEGGDGDAGFEDALLKVSVEIIMGLLPKA